MTLAHSLCTPTLFSIYRRLIPTASKRHSAFPRRLWPTWKWTWRGHRALQTASAEILRWPRWLSSLSLSAARESNERSNEPQVNKRPPDLDSPIYRLMNCPALFDPVRAPRNKIVLCHGLYGFDVRGPSAFPRLQLHYWSNVLEVLRGKIGAEVFVTGVPGTGSVEDRAKLMHATLCENVPKQPINFIAHSMGGLDCRHLISRIQPVEYRPLSLTTVSTPHRGSSFMDWCAANIGIGELTQAVEEAAIASEKLQKTIPPYSLSAPLLSRPPTKAAQSMLAQLATLPQSLTTMFLALLDSPAYANLTTHFLASTFNPQTPDAAGVKYFSVAARAPLDMSIFHPLWLPKTILDAAEAKHAGQTPEWGSEAKHQPQPGHDGLVSVESAKWGEFLGVVEGVDHWELRGAGLFRPTSQSTSWAEWIQSYRASREKSSPVDTTDEGKERAAAAMAALDWVVNAVSSVHDANPGGQADPAQRKEGEQTVWDLERFYAALCKKLYDEGL